MIMNRSSDKLSPSCSSSDEFVSYLYGEMIPSAQLAFEDHLSGCERCAAEFAELSLARLGVYEWHRDEFAVLATPRIVLPRDEVAKLSWIETVRSLVSWPALATAAGVFGILAILSGAWFLATESKDIVQGEPSFSPIAVSSPPAREKALEKVLPTGDPTVPGPANKLQQRNGPGPEVVKTGSGNNGRTARPRTAKIERNSVRPSAPRPAPRLNDFEDEDDNTLRLGDLLAEVDTRHE